MLTRSSYSRRALRWAGNAGAPWPPSNGWQRARSPRCTAGKAVTRRVYSNTPAWDSLQKPATKDCLPCLAIHREALYPPA